MNEKIVGSQRDSACKKATSLQPLTLHSSVMTDYDRLFDLSLPLNIFFYETVSRGYHEYMRTWPSPQRGELLSCIPEPNNPWDIYAISIVRDFKTVGHLPYEIAHLAFFFLQEGGTLEFETTGPRQACRAPCGGMEVPGNLVVCADSSDLVQKFVDLLETSQRAPKTAWIV